MYVTNCLWFNIISTQTMYSYNSLSLSLIFKTIPFNNYVFLFCSFFECRYCVLIKCLFAAACAWDSSFKFNVRYVTYFASSEHVNREIKTLNTHRVFSVWDRPERWKWSKVFCYIYVWAIVTAKWTIVIINFKALLWNTHSHNSSKCNTYYILHTLLSSHCENCGKEFNKLFDGLILFLLRFYRTRMRCDAMRCDVDNVFYYFENRLLPFFCRISNGP